MTKVASLRDSGFFCTVLYHLNVLTYYRVTYLAMTAMGCVTVFAPGLLCFLAVLRVVYFVLMHHASAEAANWGRRPAIYASWWDCGNLMHKCSFRTACLQYPSESERCMPIASVKGRPRWSRTSPRVWRVIGVEAFTTKTPRFWKLNVERWAASFAPVYQTQMTPRVIAWVIGTTI